jgi:hypothetical protein
MRGILGWIFGILLCLSTVTGPEQCAEGAYKMGGAPYNKITSVKSLADMVDGRGDKSGFFEPLMTTMTWDPGKVAQVRKAITHTLVILKSGKGFLKIYGGLDWEGMTTMACGPGKTSFGQLKGK